MFAFSTEGNYFTSSRRCRSRLVSKAYYLLFLLVVQEDLSTVSLCKSRSTAHAVRHFCYCLRAGVSLLKGWLCLIGLTVTDIGYRLIYCHVLRVTLITELLFETRKRLVSFFPKWVAVCETTHSLFYTMGEFMELVNWKLLQGKVCMVISWLRNISICNSNHEVRGHSLWCVPCLLIDS